MPYYAMPAKNPAEVVSFFDDLVQQGDLKVINADFRPDVWDRVEPCDDVRLIVMQADAHPPEGTDVAAVLPEFRPEPDAATQFSTWQQKPDSEPVASDASDTADIVEPEIQPDQGEPTLESSVEGALPEAGAPVESQPLDVPESALDRKWLPFSSRGFKG